MSAVEANADQPDLFDDAVPNAHELAELAGTNIDDEDQDRGGSVGVKFMCNDDGQ